ncbi:hypothetical protein [Nocardia altamirensis]|uniref:hypothetical protein n=1 Tax=Nocardia altamirensis TaxID=472158 RepID=UPI00083FF4E4|nr:hypothetical protein [Nocardia altamirensis]
MPLYLPAPEPPPARPDGQGWNRLTLGAHYGALAAQCALRPRRYPALHDTMRDTRIAQWGPYNPCIRPRRWGQHDGPDCQTCPILTAPTRTLHTDSDRVLVRVTTRLIGQGLRTQGEDTPHLVEDPATGLHGPHATWTWDELARLRGWRIGRAHHDHHGPGFWLERDPDALP